MHTQYNIHTSHELTPTLCRTCVTNSLHHLWVFRIAIRPRRNARWQSHSCNRLIEQPIALFSPSTSVNSESQFLKRRAYLPISVFGIAFIVGCHVASPDAVTSVGDGALYFVTKFNDIGVETGYALNEFFASGVDGGVNC